MTITRPDDQAFMQRALQLAARGRGYVEPNPLVGCVIVRNGRIIGEGYHRRFGGPHAEIEALRRCSRCAAGATLYVTLEPCCHYGKTPPCTDALIAAGVRRVVAAMRDPSPQVAGRGLAILRKASIRVEVGLLEKEARDSKWISDRAMRDHAHRLRGRVDAIIVGRRTVELDDPLLTCRVGRPRRIATRVVLDSMLRTPLRARLVRTARRVPTWILCGPQAPAWRARQLEKAGCVVHRVPTTRHGLSLPAVLDALGAHQMTNVMVEGGGTLLGSFFDQKLADELRIYIAPSLIGGAAAVGPLHGQGLTNVPSSGRLRPGASLRRVGSGWCFCAALSRS